MEQTPLGLAHMHARAASEETRRSRLTVAGNEHGLAAGEYARAAENTGDIEALRILNLLQEHHLKLAQIITTKNEASNRLARAKAQEVSPEKTAVEAQPAPAAPSNETPIPTVTEKPSIPQLLKASDRRDTSPALAKDIASRRGIPQTRQRKLQAATTNVSALQATGRMTSPTMARHKADVIGGTRDEHTSARPPAQPAIIASAASGDEGFAKFYSHLTTGPLSKLSSMLAFAGLPLVEQPQDDSPAQSTVEKTSARATSGPDVKHLFSKAALRALEEQQKKQGFSGSAFGPGESFYVIPTSGGTASYANILTRAQQEAARQMGDNASDEFVDAKESLGHNRTGSVAGGPPRPGSLREEELQIENAALKQILDKLSHRLQAFESHAQDASMAALTQSMASVRSHAPVPDAAAHQDMDERMRAMEAQLELEMRERERLGLENQKNKAVIAKYRSHWEQLKDSARAKAKAKQDRAESAG